MSHAVKAPRLPPGPATMRDVHADVGCASDIVYLDAFLVHAEVVMGDIEQPGTRRRKAEGCQS